MSFRIILPPPVPQKRHLVRDRSNIIDVRSQPRANGWSQQFRIGTLIASRIGLTAHREFVELLVDDMTEGQVRAGFRKSPTGHYLATLRGDHYWISIDARATAAFFAGMSYQDIQASEIEFSEGFLSFEVKRRSK